MKVCKEEKRKVKSCTYRSKEEVNEQFVREMNQGVRGNRTLVWKEVSKVNWRKLESCNRIKAGNGRLALGEDEVRRVWKDYFENLYDTDTPEQVAVYMYSVEGI